MRTDSTSFMFYRHHIVEFLARRTDSTSLRLLSVLPAVAACCAAGVQVARSKVTSVSNRWRPLHGGSYERRIQCTTTCHYSPPCRPPCQGNLPGARPHHCMASQVVAPLPAVRCRWAVRPDTGTPC